MVAPAVTPIPGLASVVTTGGTSVVVVAGGPNGGLIVNPYTAADQGLSEPEVLYIDPIGAATENANGNTFALQPGQSWSIIPGQTTPTSVNADTGGHNFVAVYW